MNAGAMPSSARPSLRAAFAAKCRNKCGMSPRRSRSGGSDDRKHVEPVSTDRRGSAPLPPRALQVAVGRGDHAHVDAQAARTADALELALLQHAQQLRLRLGRQLADLVEEQRAAVGQLEAATALLQPRR